MSLSALSKTQTTRLEKVQSVLIMKRQLLILPLKLRKPVPRGQLRSQTRPGVYLTAL